MLKIENHEVMGWEHVIRGMRNPMNSWDQSDSGWDKSSVDDNGEVISIVAEEYWDYEYHIGPNDQKLMKNLREAGTDHRKFMRMITVYLDITAPLYWWKEFDTYKVGTVANSCSTMHKIHAKEFEAGDFSNDRMDDYTFNVLINDIIPCLNYYRNRYKECEDELKAFNFNKYSDARECKNAQKRYWWQMIQLLPSSYNQKRTVMLNYEVLANIYKSRKNHKLDEWHVLCNWIEKLPYSELITGKFEEKKDG